MLLARESDIPAPPEESVPSDMKWAYGADRWVVHFPWKGQEFWFHPPRGYEGNQRDIDEICMALRNNAYHAQGNPPPPFPLTRGDALKHDFPHSQFFVQWEWNSGWSLNLYALDGMEDYPRFFECFSEPADGWKESDFDFALQSMRATIDHFRMIGWA